MTSAEISVAPSARRLATSLRDIGYSFESAIADLVDNSVTAGATEISIDLHFEGKDSTVTITDNGAGMDRGELTEAMRFGSRRSYGDGELGRYGLGLKTASISQCKRVEVISKSKSSETHAMVLDLDFIEQVDEWTVLDFSEERDDAFADGETGTIVLWSKLDRILSVKSPEGGWARRRIEALGPKLSSYLGMVFHRFLSGEAPSTISIYVNGEAINPWDPFVRNEQDTKLLSVDEFEVQHDNGVGKASLRCYLLPTRDQFSSESAYEEASGIEKWNKQQGIYIYRADRLVQWGGWAGIRTLDEHIKYARVALDFGTDLDEAFNINVAKMRVSLPGELRRMITRPISELSIAADTAYRRSQNRTSSDQRDDSNLPKAFSSEEDGQAIGLALRAAAARSGKLKDFLDIMQLIQRDMPDLAKHLGFD